MANNTFKVTVKGENGRPTPDKVRLFPFGCLITEDTRVAGCNAMIQYGGNEYHFAETTDDVLAALNGTPTVAYQVYSALLSQAGTAAPTAIELQNTIGTIAWDYISVNRYRATSELFTVDATFIPAIYDDNGVLVQVDLAGLPNYFEIVTTDDGVLTKKPVEVRVYNNASML